MRLFDLCHDERALLVETIAPHLSKLETAPKDLPVFGVGGTATTVASLHRKLHQYSAAAVQGCRISREELRLLTDRLLSLSAEERKHLPGMDVRRADIIGGDASF